MLDDRDKRYLEEMIDEKLTEQPNHGCLLWIILFFVVWIFILM